MSKFDNFFKTKPSEQLNNKILEMANVELKINKIHTLRRKIITYLVPTLAATTAMFFVFKLNNSSHTDKNFVNTADTQDVLSELIDDADSFEIVEDLALIENLEELELIEDQDWEG
jgi:hypothetical protein